jgi:hypothetical protein
MVVYTQLLDKSQGLVRTPASEFSRKALFGGFAVSPPFPETFL